jgi:patatin-related protein
MHDTKSGEEDYCSEVRFGVVMYGGVSLAIYINGVANEIYEMACATPRDGATSQATSKGEKRLQTRDVYRRLSWLVGNAELCSAYAAAIRHESARHRDDDSPNRDMWDPAQIQGQARTRLVVDVVAGTSAGGINGIFLAKALANGEAFNSLRDMWVGEGDIGLLLNDERSYKDLKPRIIDRSAKPASLLNSDRMYLKLLQAMDTMQPVPDLQRVDGESQLAEEIDLFVTTTDIVGSPVPLRLADKVVYERRHKQSYHFSYPAGTSGGNDLAPENNPFLAFAARCTSSFPFAFEPMTLEAAKRLKPDMGGTQGLKQWDAFFSGLPEALVSKELHHKRAFGDGGYLDNKPFTYVVEALSRRQSTVPLERKLIYVEPSPQHLNPEENSTTAGSPDALSNALAALTSIPQYESIREDLQSVLRRNQRIERVENLVRLNEKSVDGQRDPFGAVRVQDGQISPWSTLKLSQLVEFYGLAFLPYSRLRVFALTDQLAQGLAEFWGVDKETDHQYALRALVRFWRETEYSDEAEPSDTKQTVTAFLDQFDIEHRLRRLRFLLRKIDQATRVLRVRRKGPFSESEESSLAGLSDSDRQIIDALKRHAYALSDPQLTSNSMDRALAALHVLKVGLLDSRTSLQRQVRETRAAYHRSNPQTQAQRTQLTAVLELLLGERPTLTAPLRLATVDGREVVVALDDGWLKAASASRTMQESVVLRVRALFKAAGSTSKTQLQEALETSIESMRLKRNPRGSNINQPAVHASSARAWELLGRPHLQQTDGVVAVSVGIVQATSDKGQGLCTEADAVVVNTVEGRLLRRMFGEYYLRFDSFDQMSFPLYYDTGTGEPSTVDVIRVSPEDAPSLIDEATDPEKRKKLAGTAYFNFGAFLDERWRRNDIMWGRLDGAERLIKALLPMSDPDTKTVREELVARAHGSILREALVSKGLGDLTALLCEALAAEPGIGTESRLRTLLDKLRVGNPIQQAHLRGVLLSLLTEQGLLEYVQKTHRVDRELDRKNAMSNAARAVTITGRVLGSITQRRDQNSTAPRWLARLGLVMQGLVAVSLPGTFNQRLWTHAIKLLYAFEVLLLLLAMLFSARESRTLALTALAVTAAVHFVSLLTSDILRSRALWWRMAAGAAGLTLVASALLGGAALYSGTWRAVVSAVVGQQVELGKHRHSGE